MIWDSVLPSDLFFQDGGIFESEDMVYRHHLGTRLIALDRFLFCLYRTAWHDLMSNVGSFCSIQRLLGIGPIEIKNIETACDLACRRA